jgi:hypothetical protein
MGKSTISMVIFNSYVKLPEGMNYEHLPKIWGYFGFKCSSAAKFQLSLGDTNASGVIKQWQAAGKSPN